MYRVVRTKLTRLTVERTTIEPKRLNASQYRELLRTVRACARGIVVLVALAYGIHAGTAYAHGRDHTATHTAYVGHASLCDRWAKEIHAVPNDYRMHAMGCASPYGHWQPGATRCMRVAYHVSLWRFSYAAIGRQGCVLMEDGSWAEE